MTAPRSIHGVIKAIKAIKAIETALPVSNAKLEAFSDQVLHDLCLPLNTVRSPSTLRATECRTDGSDKFRHYLTPIQCGVAQMNELIEGMLALAHVSGRKMRSGSVDLARIAQQTVERSQQQAPTRQIFCTTDAGLVVSADSRLMHSVIHNLVGNAWKFTSRAAHGEISMGRTTTDGSFLCGTTVLDWTWRTPTSCSAPFSACTSAS